MVRKDKRNRYNAGNRQEARARHRGKQVDTARALMRERKLEGDYRDEAEFFEAERADVQFGTLADLAPAPERQVQVGPVRGDSHARVRSDGVTVVSSRELVKPRSESWTDYKLRVNASAQLAQSRVGASRVERREARDVYLDELCERLVGLHYTNQIVRYFGSKGQRQRRKSARDWQERLAKWQCIIVPDGVPGPLVIFRHAMRQLPRALADVDWTIFASERQDAIDDYEAKLRNGGVPSLPEISEGVHQSFDADLASLDFHGFASRFGSQIGSDAIEFLEAHGREVLAFALEVHALSLVPSESRAAYILSRGASAFTTSGVSVEGIKGVLLQLLSMPCVLGLVSALAVRPTFGSDVPLGEHQSIYAALANIRASIAPGTALNGAMALGGAVYAFYMSRDSGVNLGSLANAVFRSVARLPRVDSPDEAVAVAVRYGPVVAAAVSAAIATRSFMPLLRGSDTSYTRYVDVQTAYELRRQGRYDGDLFPDDNSFYTALCDCCDEVEPAVKRGDLLAIRMWKDLVSMRSQIRTEMQGKLRVAPFAFAVVGESSIGKSDVMMKAIARLTYERYGKAASNDEIYTRQQWDNYWSGYKQSKKVVIFDDTSNARAAPGTTIPNQCAAFIQVINNIPQPLNMADVESKGNVSFTSEFVVASSNLRDLGASTYSNEPVSVLRRFNVFVEPVVREEYRRPNSYMLDPSKVPDPSVCPVPNLWRFKVMEAVRRPGSLTTEIDWRPIDFPADGSMVDLMELLCARSRDHFAYQAAFVKAHSNRDYASLPLDVLRSLQDPGVRVSAMPSAEHQGAASSRLGVTFPVRGLAALDGDRPIATAEVPPPPFSYGPRSTRVSSFIGRFFDGVCHAFVGVAEPALSGVRSAIFDMFVDAAFVRARDCITSYVTPMNVAWYLLLCGTLPAFVHFLLAMLLMGSTMEGNRASRRMRGARVMGTIASFSAVAGLTIWLLTRRGAPAARHQGVAEMVEEAQRIPVVLRPSDVPHETQTRTFSQAKELLRKRGRFAIFETPTAMSVGVLFPLRKGLYATSRHIVRPVLNAGAAVIKLHMFAHGAGPKQSFQIAPSQIYCPSPDHDIAFVGFAGPTERDARLDVMPDAWLRGMSQEQAYFPVAEACVLATRVPPQVLAGRGSPVGSLSSVSVRLMGAPRVRPVRFGQDVHTVIAMSPVGLLTLAGDCGSPLLVSARVGGAPSVCVAGLHSGVTRVGGEDLVVTAPLTQSMVAAADAYFATATYQGSVRLFGQPADLRLNTSRSHPLLPQHLPYVQPLGVLENEQGVNVSSLNTFKSNLVRGMFYEPGPVDDVLGPRAHGFPVDTRSMAHYIRPLEAMATKDSAFEPPVLDQALRDFKVSLRIALGDAAPTRPASLFEATNTDGVQPTLQLGTSAGFGRKGHKHRYVDLACTRGCTDEGCVRFHPSGSDHIIPGRDNFYPDPEVRAEVSALIEALARGDSDLAIFRASLKDEAVAIGKTKIRAFYVAAMALNLVVRMYLMPFVSRLQGRPGYECMVGIDPQGPAWEALQCSLEARHATRRLAGDYKAFDLTTSETLLAAFYESIVDLALDAGWDSHAISVMRGLGKNLSRPVYLFLGQAYRVSGSNPSGVAITTHTNSGVNALIHRYAFYARNRHLLDRPCQVSALDTLFTRSVCLRTYGDDVVGSVADVESVDSISNYDVRDAAGAFGMVFGPTDKASDELPPYYEASSVEFLKRTTVYVPSLGHRVGAIALSSIRKSIAFEERGDFEKRRSTLRSALILFFPHAAKEGVEDPDGKFSGLRDLFLGALAASEGVDLASLSPSVLPAYADVLASSRDCTPEYVVDCAEGEYQCARQ